MNRFRGLCPALTVAILSGAARQTVNAQVVEAHPAVWAGGNGSWANTGNWVSVFVPPYILWPNNGSWSLGAVSGQSYYLVSINNGRADLNDLSSVSSLDVGSTGQLRIATGSLSLSSAPISVLPSFVPGVLNNNGVITLEDVGRLSGDILTIGGSGRIEIGGGGTLDSIGILTNTGNHTIKNNGDIAGIGIFNNLSTIKVPEGPPGRIAGVGEFNNQGDILLESTGGLRINLVNAFTNDDLVQSSAGTLTLQDLSCDNNSEMRARTTGSIRVTDSSFRNDGLLTGEAGAVRFDDSTLDNNSSTSAVDHGLVRFDHTSVDNGGGNLAATQSSRIEFADASSLTGGLLSSDTTSLLAVTSGDVTLTGSITLAGTFDVQAGRALIPGFNLNNVAGLFRVSTTAAPSVISQPSSITGGKLDGPGRLEATQSLVLDGTPGLINLGLHLKTINTAPISGGVFGGPPQTVLTLHQGIDNRGLIEIGGRTTLTPGTPTVTFSGTGFTLGEAMSDGFGAPLAILSGPAGYTIVNEAGHTLGGALQLGQNNLNLINRGILASTDPAGGALLLQFTGRNLDNDGLIVARAGSRLYVEPGTLDNRDGTLRADSGGVVHLRNATTVLGGRIESAGTGFVRTDVGGGTPVLDGSPAGGLTLAGTYRSITPGNTLLRTRLRNDGLFSVEQSTVTLESAPFTFSGNGVLRFSDNVNPGGFPQQSLGFAAPGILTNEAGHTIAGVVALGGGTASIVNNGSVIADSPLGRPLLIQNTGRTFTNSGDTRATGGGWLIMEGGIFQNTGGLIKADTASRTSFRGNPTITGGTIRSAGTGYTLLETGQFAVFDGSGTEQVTTEGSFQAAPGATLEVRSRLHNQGTVTVTGARINLANSPVTFSGNGTVRFAESSTGSGYPAESLLFTAPGIFTNAAGHTLAGVATLGGTFTSMENRGTMLADSPLGRPLVLRQTGRTFLNAGDTRASGGGWLIIEGGTIQNTDGLLLAEAGSRVSFRGSPTVTGGTLRSVSSGYLQIEGSQTTTFDGSGTQPVTVEGTIYGDATSGLSLRGSILGSANWALDRTNVTLTGPTTLGGTGVLNFSGFYNFQGSGPLTIAASQTLRGSVSLSNTQFDVTNAGTLVADQSTKPFTISLGAGRTLSNTGLLKATGGGILRINSGVTDNSGGGRLMVENASAFVFETGSITHIRGGSLTSSGSGTFSILGTANFDGSTAAGPVSLDGRLNVSGARLNFTGPFVNNGIIDAGGGQIDILGPGAALNGPGQLRFPDRSGAITQIQSPGAVRSFSIGSGQTLDGPVTISSGSLNVSNAGTVRLASALGGVSNFSLGFDRTGTNTGLISVSGGTLLFEGGNWTNSGGVIEQLPGSTMALRGASIVGGTVRSSGNSYFQSAGRATTLDGTSGGGLSLEGNWVLSPSTTLALERGVSLRGTTGMYGGTGQFGVNVAWLRLLNPVSVTLSGGGTLRTMTAGGGVNQITGQSAATRCIVGPDYSIEVPTATNLSVQTPLTVQGRFYSDGAVDLANASLAGDPSGTFSGHGRFDFTNRTLLTGGTISPGGAPGTPAGNLAFYGNVTMAPTSQMRIEIGGTAPADFDSIGISQTGLLDGYLFVTLTNGFTPGPADTFTVLTTGPAITTLANIKNRNAAGRVTVTSGAGSFLASTTNGGRFLTLSDWQPATSLSFAAWRLLGQFTPAELADLSISGPLADPDGDGRSNAVEWLLGTDARTPGLPNEPSLMPVPGGNYAFRFTLPKIVADQPGGLPAVVETTNTLLPPFVNAGTPAMIAQDAATRTYEVILSGMQRHFVRLRAITD